MENDKISNKKLAFYIALVYVILATIYTYWAMSNLVSDGFLYYIFFPATIFASLILFTEREPGILLLICQTITLLIIWLLFWFFINLLRDDINKQEFEKES